MGKMQRDKGARFERFVAALFKDQGYEAYRSAQHDGKTGHAADVEGVPDLHIECKAQERMELYKWIDQAIRDNKARKELRTPVVVHKANNKPVLVTMLFDDWIKLYNEWECGENER